MKRLTPLILAIPLLLAGCASSVEDSSTPSPFPDSETSTTSPTEPEVHALSDTVIIGDSVTISDIEIDTTGCEFNETPARDAVKFQIIATVENATGEEITEALWASEMTFIDPDGFTVSPLDIVQGEPPCSNDNPREFNSMAAGEKRRAAVTLEAPAGATEMTYNTSLIEGAQPVRWNVSEEIADMNITSTNDLVPDVEAPAPQQSSTPPQAEQPSPTPQQNSIWAEPGQGYQCPQTDAFVHDPADCTPENLGAGPIPDLSTIPFADGGTCPAAICGYGTDENGNPNPSSGEIQTLDGCEQGYITDPNLCATIYERFGY